MELIFKVYNSKRYRMSESKGCLLYTSYPNQVNNVLCFPGLFRGVLDARASDVNDEMKVAAAYAIAGLVSDGP